MSKNKRDAFESLHQKYFLMITQMCLGFTKGDYDEANDLSQEVLIHIWNNIGGFKGKSAYKTWIYRITVNTCLQYIRKEKKVQKLPLTGIENTLIEEPKNTTPDETQKLYKAIGQLNKLDRLVIMMILEGQNQAIIGDVLGINPINVRVKIHRIKKRLKRLLENED